MHDVQSGIRVFSPLIEALREIASLCIDGLIWIIGVIGFQTIVLLGAMMSMIRLLGH